MALDLVEDKDLTKVNKDGQYVIHLARRLGWAPSWPSRQRKMIQLIPPKDARNTSPINVPMTNINHKRVRALVRQVIYASPESAVMRAAAADAAVSLMERGVSPEVVAEAKKSLGPPIPRPPAITDMKFEPEPDDSLPGMEGSPVVEVSRRPFNARGGSRVTYQSEYADEVTLSDGSVRWECTFPGCPYVSTKGGASVSSHHAKKHGSRRLVEEEPHEQGDEHPQPSHRETPEAPEQQPEGDRLAQWLQKFIDSEVQREVAKREALHEEEKAALRAQIDSLTTELEGCREEAKKYRENMTTIRDLLNEVIG